jgi:photosystem II stability/assembly factor-like uncharacterized protein
MLPWYANLHVSSLLINPKYPSTLYGIIGDLGVSKSEDGGRTWHEADAGIGIRKVYRLAIDPENPAILYTVGNNAVHKSTDGGMNWKSIRQGLPVYDHFGIFSIAVDPSTPTTVYIGTDSGIYQSMDGGGKWRKISELGSIASFAVNPRTSTTLSATGLTEGVFKSTDSGYTWMELDGLGFFHSWWANKIIIDPTMADTVYVGLKNGV